MKISKQSLKDLTYRVNGAAIEVHRNLGPGLLESIYHRALVHELSIRKIQCWTELPVEVDYKGVHMETKLRCDLLIENCMIVELKSVDAIHPIHKAQLLTYMRLLQIPKGILYNFNVINLFKQGQSTLVNKIFASLED